MHPRFNQPLTPNFSPAAPVESTQAKLQRAMALHQSGQLDPAKAIYEEILAKQPRNADVLSLLAIVATQTLDHRLAADLIAKAIKIRPADPGYHVNRGIALKELKQLDQALASFNKAIALKPDYVEAYSNRGIVLKELKRLPDAIASFDKAIAIKPGNVHAQWNKAIALLLAGDFEQGWALHEWRWHLNDQNNLKRNYPQPMWLGQESLNGKTILLYAEQGLGDTIQMCRYAQSVKALGAHVVMEAPKALREILQGLSGIDTWITQGEAPPAFDFHCPMLSLPHALKARLDGIPNAQTYLKSDPSRIEKWAAQLGPKSMPRIGLVWSGNPVHKNDHNRSIALPQLLASLPQGLEYISLQKELRGTDTHTLQSHPHIRHFGAELESYADTAALCTLLDVVISVDTSVAHLNGALGNPTWILLPHSPDWRWLLERDDSPWYSSVTLYRQAKPDDWNTVLERVQSDLARLLDSTPHGTQ